MYIAGKVCGLPRCLNPPYKKNESIGKRPQRAGTSDRLGAYDPFSHTEQREDERRIPAHLNPAHLSRITMGAIKSRTTYNT